MCTPDTDRLANFGETFYTWSNDCIFVIEQLLDLKSSSDFYNFMAFPSPMF